MNVNKQTTTDTRVDKFFAAGTALIAPTNK